jgi:DNA-directed RNA polymerase specialized sigma24 family protein
MTTDPRPKIGDVVPDTSYNHKARKRNSTQRALLGAFAAFQRGESSQWALLEPTRNFLRDKLYGLEIDSGFRDVGTSETVDDRVQDLLLKIWRVVERGGVRGSYYALCNRAARNEKKDFLDYLRAQRHDFPSIETPNPTGDDGEPTDDSDGSEHAKSVENRDIYENRAITPGTPGEPKFFTREYIEMLPQDERNVCISMLGGKTPAQIAAMQGRPLHKINNLIASAKKKCMELKAIVDGQVQSETAARDDAYNAQIRARLAAKRSSKPVRKVVMLEDEDETTAV